MMNHLSQPLATPSVVGVSTLNQREGAYNEWCRTPGMFDAERFKERLAASGLSQSALARRTGVSQQAISRLLKGERYGSRYLHRIAYELGTTAAYLMGETDDPLAEAAPLPEVTFEDRQMLGAFDALAPSSKNAISTLIKDLATRAEPKSDLVASLPSEHVLTVMFEALLSGIDPKLSRGEQAQLLARRLPIGLSQLHDVQIDYHHAHELPADREEGAKPAKRRLEPQR